MSLTNNGVTLKLFIGYHLTTDIEIRLNQNVKWKQFRIDSGQNSRNLSEVYFQERKYLGCFMETSTVTFAEIKKAEKEINAIISGFDQDLTVDSAKMYVFSQIFII